MLIGPVFTREWLTAPRRVRTYVSRSVYVATLLGLTFSAWIVLTGTQDVRNLGDLARFGAVLFQILAPLQLALAIFISALLTASAVAQEKDRRTLVLLLLTNLTNSELVLGKLLASLLNMAALLLAAAPLLALFTLFGGVSFGQIGRVLAVTLASAVAAGSLGSTIALWREKTFQILATTALGLVAWLGAWSLVDAGALGASWHGVSTHAWAIGFSPLQAILAAARPIAPRGEALWGFHNPIDLFLAVAAAMSVLLNGLAIWRVRVWNPSREARTRLDETPASALRPSPQPSPRGRGSEAEISHFAEARIVRAAGKTRAVWSQPVAWREIRTWAYGRKVLAVKFGYLLICALAALALHGALRAGSPLRGDATAILAPLFVLSLVLVNALAVTSISTERDGRALDLLLVTDITPAEFIFGKLCGVFYNAKELILAPMLLCGYLCVAGALSVENLLYLLGGLAVMDSFVAMLGVHAGLIYSNSRSAIGVSLGTVFFLFVGIATCIRIMVSFSGSYQMQLAPFLAFMIGGAAGLFFALGVRNPSPAIGWASVACPTFTYVAITSFLQQQTLGVFAIVALTYGFTTAAMLVPAVYDFDVTTGRTSAEE